jgi:hypothetical protein
LRGNRVRVFPRTDVSPRPGPDTTAGHATQSADHPH